MKKTKKGVIAAVAVAAAVAVIAVTAVQAHRSAAAAAAAANAPVTAKVERQTITKTVTGSGSLSDDDPQDVKTPAGIRIDKVKVSRGDTVEAGDVLATVDAASVKQTISSIQDAIISIDSSLEELGNEKKTQTLTAPAGGEVVHVYAEEGEDAASVMKDKGSLVTISVDGQPLEITATSGEVSKVYVTEGATVKQGADLVRLTDVTDTAEQQKLLSQRKNLTDALNAAMELDETGEIRATTAGTVDKVNVSDDTTVTAYTGSASGSTTDAGSLTDSLAGLTGVSGMSASSADAQSGRILQMTAKAKENTVRAGSGRLSLLSGEGMPEDDAAFSQRVTDDAENSSSGQRVTDGDVSSSGGQQVTGGTVLPSSGQSGTTSPASGQNAPDSTTTSPESGQSGTDPSETQLQLIGTAISLPLAAPVAGEKAMTAADLQSAAAGETGYTVSGLAWLPGAASDGTFGNGISYTALVTLQADTANGWFFDASATYGVLAAGSADSVTAFPANIARVGDQTVAGSLLVFLKYPSTEAGGADLPAITGEILNTWKSAVSALLSGAETDPQALLASLMAGSISPADYDLSGLGGMDLGGYDMSGLDTSGLGASLGSGSLSGSISGADSALATSFTIALNEKMAVDISIDELDINSVSQGQEASVTLDAIPDQTFTGEVSSVNKAGSTGTTGVTKYAVTVTLPKSDGMLSGMNATVEITVGQDENVLVIPSDAVQEDGSRTFVYTSVDPDGTLSGEREIKTGLADADNVEVTEGLDEGETVCYAKSAGEAISDSTVVGFGMYNGGEGDEE